ncbi:hypothetical protein MSG28_007373 [Choristoneura fumiferana]|uniref:Uncharacterized protein n=1 Tax=Choristoneura fumiferana TaxID=7141 RepID=A0ACC0JXC6_CHOFU|nr:hypothetical protein MSG28_007373 [Choristoneura fumiferana]
MNDDKQFWLVKKTIAKLVSFESVAILRRSASLQLLATTNLTTSRPHSMKKKTRAGAQRSKGSPTITCEYAASTIRATSPMLAAFFILSIFLSAVKFIFPIMSDDGSTAVEKKGRGRPKANGTQAEAKADTKKRGRPPAATKAKESTKSSDDEQAPVAKRGRGRPKGSKKRAAAPKAKGGSGEGRGRGRPRKDAPPPRKDAASTEEEQDDEDEDEGSDQ